MRVLGIIVALAFGFSAQAFEIESQKWAITGSYQLNAQNPDGTNPTSTISLSASPSLIMNDIHEVGGTLTYSVTKTENTVADTTSEVSTTMITGFYRFNMDLLGADAKYPVIGYAGPQAGISSLEAGGESSSDPSLGAQVGVNVMFSENLALNVHIFQFDTVFAEDTQLLITQSVGVKYFF